MKLSNLQLNALKSGRKNFAEVTLYLPSNVIGDSNYKANFPHKLLFTVHKFQDVAKLLQTIH